jgi:hypothetical protein
VQAEELPELYVKVDVPEPLTLPPVDTHAVPTLKTFTAALASFVPVTTILSAQDPNPSSLISYNLKLTGPLIGVLNVIVVVIVLVVLVVQSVESNIP